MHSDGTVPDVAVAWVGMRYDNGTLSFLVIGSSTQIHFSPDASKAAVCDGAEGLLAEADDVRVAPLSTPLT